MQNPGRVPPTAMSRAEAAIVMRPGPACGWTTQQHGHGFLLAALQLASLMAGSFVNQANDEEKFDCLFVPARVLL